MEVLTELNNFLTREGFSSELREDSLLIKHQAKNEEVLRNKINDWQNEHKVNFVMNIEHGNFCGTDCPICNGKEIIVRVAGFSAYFVDMAREVQDQIIARTKQRF